MNHCRSARVLRSLLAMSCVLWLVLASGCTREKGPIEREIDEMMAADLPINGGLARVMAKGCQQDDARACADLGILVEDAMRASSDMRYANPCIVHALFTTACEADDAKGCYALGRHFVAGTCTERDNQRGRELVEKSCVADFVPACNYLVSQWPGAKAP